VRTRHERLRSDNVKQAREAEPYLVRLGDDWATGQILRQYINGNQKYENAKARGKVKVRAMRQQTSPTLGTSKGDKLLVAAGNETRGWEL
jgi:hypothetical protein